MRLFIAVNFDDQTKQKISQTADLLKKAGVKGNYTKDFNYHITLLFLGESDQNQIISAKKAITQVKLNTFDITFQNISNFGKNIVYLGVNNSWVLKDINQFLFEHLKDDFLLKDNRFSPHITLIRKPDFIPTAISTDGLLPSKYTVKEISLMQSVRIDGELIYKPLFCHKLNFI